MQTLYHRLAFQTVNVGQNFRHRLVQALGDDLADLDGFEQYPGERLVLQHRHAAFGSNLADFPGDVPVLLHLSI